MLVSDYYMSFIVLHFALIGHKYLLLFRYLLQIVHNTLILSLKPVSSTNRYFRKIQLILIVVESMEEAQSEDLR